jgi:hypothetical protein
LHQNGRITKPEKSFRFSYSVREEAFTKGDIAEIVQWAVRLSSASRWILSREALQ